jgi:dihydrofolate synthase/folylpolyglutamate synthase
VATYAETIAFLQGLEVSRGWDLKLERMHAACALRGHPERRFAVVHVAGTNGKGSTVATIECVLRAAGFRTGLYTSPHLVDFCERIRAGGATIPQADVVGLVAAQREALGRAGIELTHFEFATLLAFEWFARIGVEIAVVEVGLGGRLDATNVVTPVVTAITSIGIDHEEFLGQGIEAIAGEKAGIAKPDVPIVVGVLPAVAHAVIARRAAEVGAPVRAVAQRVSRDARGRLSLRLGDGAKWRELAPGLPGAFQADNAAVALTVLAELASARVIPEQAVRSGLASVDWPGRFARLGEDPLIVVDGAHNPDGMHAFVREFRRVDGGRRAVLVFAVMADKPWREMLEIAGSVAERFVLTRVGRRGLDPRVAAEALTAGIPVEIVEEPQAAVARGLALARHDRPVAITGSLFLAGEAYRACGRSTLFPVWHGWGEGGTEAAP